MVLVVGDRGADDAAHVDATVRVEGAVLGGERGFDDPRRDVVQRYHDAMVAFFADIRKQVAVAVVDERVLVHLVGGKPADRRQGANRLGGDGGDAQQRQEGHNHQTEDYRAAQVTAAPLSPAGGVAAAPPAGGAAARKPQVPGKTDHTERE